MEKDFIKFDREALKIVIQLEGQKDLIIGKNDVEISHFSKGHGGQNVNRHMNGVRLIYPIPESHLRFGSKTREIVTRSIVSRSIEHNLKEAFTQLAKKLHHYFYIPPTRKKRKISKKAKERRLEEKKHRAAIKESRKPPKLDL